MKERIRPAVAPAYLFLCLLLGGSPQGVWGNAILQIIAVALIAWALIEGPAIPLQKAGRTLLVLVAAAILLGLLQLVPLPYRLWSAIPGREFVVQGFQLLGLEPEAMSVSLAPYDSIATLLTLLPPSGMLAATLILKAYKSNWLAGALLSGALAGVLLGILQVSSPDPASSPWYLYRISNFGVAVGFFANSNHMASLLLASIAFIAALGAGMRESTKKDRDRMTALALAGGGMAVVIVGLLLNRSLAGYGLGLPVVLASIVMLFGVKSRPARGTAVAAAIASLLAIGLLWMSPVGARIGATGTETSISSRQEMLQGSMELVRTFGAVGSGLGTFAKLYPMTEDPNEVGRIYVNHAHNDFVELAIETGLPGVLLMLAFLAWWAVTAWRVVQSPSTDQFAIAGVITTAAILLHSMVDYPLRTAAISAVFAMSLALTLQSRRITTADSDLRPVRHVVIG